MGGRASKSKGARGETQLKEYLAEYNIDTNRTPFSGALEWMKGDLTGWPGHHVECKRVEKLDLPSAIRQAHDDCPEGDIPLVVHRRNKTKKNGIMGEWFVTLKLDDYLSELGYERG